MSVMSIPIRHLVLEILKRARSGGSNAEVIHIDTHQHGVSNNRPGRNWKKEHESQINRAAQFSHFHVFELPEACA
jgi:hypothetical protein